MQFEDEEEIDNARRSIFNNLSEQVVVMVRYPAYLPISELGFSRGAWPELKPAQDPPRPRRPHRHRQGFSRSIDEN
jgi:hypothetical protein